jgi:hypothetical protein
MASKNAGPSRTTRPTGMSLAITFHVAVLAARRAFSAASWPPPRIAESGDITGWRFSLFAPR